MSKKVIVFAGTNEGREICEFLCGQRIETTACVATDYGSVCLEEIRNLHILEGRLDKTKIEALIENYDYVIDASHPYAKIITENIVEACANPHFRGKRIRILRESYGEQGMVFADFSKLCEYLNQVEGKVLVTTGSKDLHYLKKVRDYKERMILRILPSLDSLKTALDLGYAPRNIICMQGPFTTEMNVAMLRQMGAAYLVSKDTGLTGGFPEKVEASRLTGVKLLTIGRPSKEVGVSLKEAKEYLAEAFAI